MCVWFFLLLSYHLEVGIIKSGGSLAKKINEKRTCITICAYNNLLDYIYITITTFYIHIVYLYIRRYSTELDNKSILCAYFSYFTLWIPIWIPHTQNILGSA